MATIWSWQRHNPVTVSADRDGVNIKTSEDLYHAAAIGDIPAVRDFISNGGDINAKNDYQWNALMLAAFNDRKDVVQLLIEAKAGLDAKNGDGETALILAVKTVHTAISPDRKISQIETVRFLIGAGADMHAADRKGWTALKWAEHNRLLRIVKILKSAGAAE